MPTIRATVGQISKPARIRFTSQGVYIEGVQEIFRTATATMQAIADNIEGVTDEAMYNAAKPIFELSQEYVPVKSGDLKRSGFLEKQSGHRIAIGYGRGGRPWYAAYVHEMTTFRHREPTRAKFLESAVHERLHTFKALLLQSVQKKVGSAGRVR